MGMTLLLPVQAVVENVVCQGLIGPRVVQGGSKVELTVQDYQQRSVEAVLTSLVKKKRT